jgi:putative aldouronate transport system substrate-binding protein
MRWLDWFMSEEGTLTAWLGGKGVGYTDADPGATGVDGPATFKTIDLKPGDQYYGNREWGQRFPLYRHDKMYAGWQKADDPLAPDGSGHEKFLTMKTRENYAPYGQKVENLIPPMYYSTANASEMAMLTANINTYVEESIAKFIVGDLNIDTGWTTFQNTLKNLGLDRYLQIVQTTYDNSAFAKK